MNRSRELVRMVASERKTAQWQTWLDGFVESITAAPEAQLLNDAAEKKLSQRSAELGSCGVVPESRGVGHVAHATKAVP